MPKLLLLTLAQLKKPGETPLDLKYKRNLKILKVNR